MPKLALKIPAGKGSIIQYESGTSAGQFFYRQLTEPGSKRYVTKKIEGATTLEEAKAKVFDTIGELAHQITRKEIETQIEYDSRWGTASTPDLCPFPIPIAKAVDAFIKNEQKRADSGEISQRRVSKKEAIFRLHVIPYLRTQRAVNTKDIKPPVFDQYIAYRKQKNATAQLLKQEVNIISEFCRKHLVSNKLLSRDVYLDETVPLLPTVKIKQTDRQSNPAIGEHDWQILLQQAIQNALDDQLTELSPFRYIFCFWIRFQKSSGLSPEETLKMKWSQLEIVKEGDIETLYVATMRSKTQQLREVAVDFAKELKQLKAFYEAYLKAKNKQPLTKDSLVFGNPNNEMKAWAHARFGSCWRELREQVADKLEGHISGHNYTLYSLRSSFVEDRLLAGHSVFEVALAAGHDVKMTQHTYQQLNARRLGNQQVSLLRQQISNNNSTSIDIFDL